MKDLELREALVNVRELQQWCLDNTSDGYIALRLAKLEEILSREHRRQQLRVINGGKPTS